VINAYTANVLKCYISDIWNWVIIYNVIIKHVLRMFSLFCLVSTVCEKNKGLRKLSFYKQNVLFLLILLKERFTSHDFLSHVHFKLSISCQFFLYITYNEKKKWKECIASLCHEFVGFKVRDFIKYRLTFPSCKNTIIWNPEWSKARIAEHFKVMLVSTLEWFSIFR